MRIADVDEYIEKLERKLDLAQDRIAELEAENARLLQGQISAIQQNSRTMLTALLAADDTNAMARALAGEGKL